VANGGQSSSGGRSAAAGSPVTGDAGAGGTTTATNPDDGSAGDAGETNHGGTSNGGGASIPEGSFPWPADGGAPTAFETPLPVGCKLSRVPPWWTAADHSEVLGECGTTLSSIPLDGSTPTEIAEFSGQLTIVDAGPKRVVFLDSTFLKSAPVAGGKTVTLASDVKLAKASLDGTRVVYIAPLTGSGNPGLFSVASTGGTPVTLSDSLREGVLFENGDVWWFTADSQTVWFTTSDSFLATVPIKGGDIKKIGVGPRDEGQRIWSSDGRKIAYQGFDNSNGRVARVLSADADAAVDLLLPADISLIDLAISPAGDSVWFSATHKDKQVELLAAPTSGGEWSQLAKYDNLRVLGPVGKDSTQLLFSAKNGQASPDLLVVPLSGGEPHSLGTLSSLCDFLYVPDQVLPGLSADKRKLAFIDSSGALLLADLDSAKVDTVLTSAAALTKSGLCSHGTILSPDTKRVAVPPILGKGNTAVVDLKGNVLATDPGAGAVSYSFSADSSLLEHHNLYGLRVLSIDDNEVKYTYNDAAGRIRNVVWIDEKRLTVPVSAKSYEQIVTIQ